MRDPKSTVLHKWFDSVWNQDNENAIDKLMSEDSFAHGILTEGQPKGAAGFKLFFRDFRRQFHNIEVDIEDVICQDDVEAARTTIKAIHTETGKNVTFSGICMARVKQGKIAEAWNNYDFLGLYQQLGLQLTPVSES